MRIDEKYAKIWNPKIFPISIKNQNLPLHFGKEI
jgi:hypothetical protein